MQYRQTIYSKTIIEHEHSDERKGLMGQLGLLPLANNVTFENFIKYAVHKKRMVNLVFPIVKITTVLFR